MYFGYNNNTCHIKEKERMSMNHYLIICPTLLLLEIDVSLKVHENVLYFEW